MSGPRIARGPDEVADSFDIMYAAHTASCTFLLDGNGICRRIVMTPGSKRREASKNAARCVGAQYVATLDAHVPGCLVELPKVGAPMLFARIDENGRIALVRTGAVTAFETKRADDPDPFKESVGVMTSAPAAEELHTPRARTERRNVEASKPPGSHAQVTTRPTTKATTRREAAHDPYVEHPERTQRIHALRPDELDPQLLATDEYESEPHTIAPRTTLPSATPQPQARTLHDPRVQLSPVEDPDDPYVGSAYAPKRVAVVRRRREG